MYERIVAIIRHRWPMSGQIAKYIVAGGTASLTELVFLYVFTQFLGIWYLYSLALAFMVAFSISFSLQKFWTFQDKKRDGMHKQASVYLLVSVCNLGVNIVLLYVLVQIAGLWYIFAQVLVDVIIAVSSFLIYKFFIFHKRV